MAVLTAGVNVETRDRGATSYRIDDAGSITVFAGALVGLDASSGLAIRWNNNLTTRFIGLAKETRTSTSGALLQTSVPVDTEGPNIIGIPIASAVAGSVGEKVFCTTDNVKVDCKLAGTSGSIGVIIAVRSATDCDIRLYTPTEWRAANGAVSIVLLTDDTGGTANDTLAVIDATMVPIGGSGMTTAQEAEYNATMAVVADNFADLAAKMNELLAI